MPESVRNYAIKKGLYAIVQTGDTVRIDIPEGFQPREW
jgi:dihydroxyacid dehydratase/phosphogluconate dehydratase